MIDEREQFGRVVRGFAPPNDAFERFVDRKGRKQRNRRVRAGALGVIVALAAGIFFVRSLTSDGVPATPPVEPTPGPLSGAIAYELRGQILVAGPDGSNPVAVADVVAMHDECPGQVFTRFPSWSPDGRYLAFDWECFDPALSEVVIADLQGNVVESFRVAQAYPQPMAWSPDSTRVAVWDEYHWRQGTYSIGVHGIDGTHETFAMPPGWAPYVPDGGPVWAPDGASLIVSELEVPLDGGTPREIPFHGEFMDRSGGWWGGALVYSPDGSQMAYGTPQGLMVARADGSDPRAVSDDGAHTAAWSPDGELIAVASNGDGAGNVAHPENWNGEWQTEQSPNRLRVVDVATGSIDGSDARQIAVGTNTGVLRPV
jgi:hypothetical protein